MALPLENNSFFAACWSIYIYAWLVYRVIRLVNRPVIGWYKLYRVDTDRFVIRVLDRLVYKKVYVGGRLGRSSEGFS